MLAHISRLNTLSRSRSNVLTNEILRESREKTPMNPVNVWYRQHLATIYYSLKSSFNKTIKIESANNDLLIFDDYKVCANQTMLQNKQS